LGTNSSSLVRNAFSLVFLRAALCLNFIKSIMVVNIGLDDGKKKAKKVLFLWKENRF
jgi:hypothetical protein